MLRKNVKGLECITEDLEEDLYTYMKLVILLYADDTVLFAENLTDLQLQLDAFMEYCDFWKLKVNVSKTKAMVFSNGQMPRNLDLHIGNERIEFVKAFNYLG